MSRPLVVGVGNPDRGDDGVGWAVAERAGADLRLAGAQVRRVVQLAPELAADLAGASVVVIADARAGAPPGRVEWSAVDAGEAPVRPGPLSHHLDPPALVRLAALAYGAVPAVFVVGVGAAGFASGAPLSPAVSAAVDEAAGLVVWLTGWAMPPSEAATAGP